MSEPVRPYHHGNLREALIDAATRRVETDGPAGISMRELAREIGVSHAAPRSHFPDRGALFDALACRGFKQLADALHDATAQNAEELEARFRAVMAAFVTFAADHGELLDLMFAQKRANHDPASQLEQTADQALEVISQLIAEATRASVLAPGDPQRQWYLLASLTRGIAALVTSGDIAPDAADTLITDATTTFLRGNAPTVTPTTEQSPAPQANQK